MTDTFTLSIETTEGKTFQYGFHLGTDEMLARKIAEEKFHARVKHSLPVVTVAILRKGKLVAVYDGSWDHGPNGHNPFDPANWKLGSMSR